VSIKPNKGEGATSLHQGLPPQEGATSPRGAHLLIPHVLKSNGFAINQIQSMDIVPFDLLIDFAFKFSPNLSPFILFLF
jgi:hypothetical protein